MAARSVAGMVEYMAMFPVYTLKIICKCSQVWVAHTRLERALMSIVKSKGPFKFSRGIVAMGLGARPTYVVFLCMRFAKRSWDGHHTLTHVASMILATIVSDVVRTPMEKQRL
eukprot:Gb_31828 [translate_table: standard]